MRKVVIPRKMFGIVMVIIQVSIYQKMKQLESRSYIQPRATPCCQKVDTRNKICMANDVIAEIKLFQTPISQLDNRQGSHNGILGYQYRIAFQAIV